MSRRAIRILGLACLVCLPALSLQAAPENGKIAGIVVDPLGTPQMGATVIVSSEQLLNAFTIQLLTNDHGRFSTSALPVGLYSVKVTLAGFLPALDQHIQIDGDHAALLQVVLGSALSSFEKLRRPANQSVAADDWTWVLRASAANRTILRWQDSSVSVAQSSSDDSQAGSTHGLLDLTSGAARPGSISAAADSPATAFVYDLGAGSMGQVLMAGQFSYEDAASAIGLAGEWFPSGQEGVGPVTTVLVRDSRLGPGGPEFRGVRMSHDGEFSLSNAVTVRYGAEYLMADLNGTTAALRPRGEVVFRAAPGWETSLTVAARPWQNGQTSEGSLESALATLDALPTLLVRDGRPVFENGLHEEIAVDHTLGRHADLSAALFHDLSTHTAVIGHGGAGNADFLQDYFSQAFAYDGGDSSSTGARVAYRQKFNDDLSATIIYAYAGALTPDGESASVLREELETRNRHSVAARVTTTVPHLGTKVSASYKWLSGTTVSRVDPYGESLYHVDPYLGLEVRQPLLPGVLPCHVEVQADVGNLLAQGYVTVATTDGGVILVPSYRFFRGGLSLQF